jgi:hypothetical protein
MVALRLRPFCARNTSKREARRPCFMAMATERKLSVKPSTGASITEGQLSLRSRDLAACSPPSASYAIFQFGSLVFAFANDALNLPLRGNADYLEESTHSDVEAIIVHFFASKTPSCAP